MAKSTRSVPQAMELGPDTSGCASLTLHGPPGYTYYRWNDTLGEDSVLIVFHTGIYWLAAAHEDLCWTYDTVQVVIDSLPDILLGEDTIIHRKDSLILVLPDGCNQYLWSTGETTATLILRGWELGTGSHLLWGEAVRGACIDRDTLLVSVIGNPGVWESRSLWPRVYPNPTTGIVTISEEGPEVIWTIYDLSGRVLYNGVTEGRPSALRQIDLSGLLPGLYLLELEQVQRRVRIKLIKR